MASSSLLDLYNVGMGREPVGGDYGPRDPKLIDRFTMLPIGQYDDNSLTLAWPQMAIDAYEGAVRSFEQGRQLPRVDSEGYYAGTPRAEPLDAFNAASIAPMGTVGLRATGLTKDVGDLGMFAGRGAKTADHAKLAEAERLASQGAPREQIWNDTGWFQGVDGKWRFEIDDRSASFSPTTGSFGDALNHPGLLDAYPDIMRYPTAVSADTQHLGSFHPHKREFMVTAEGGRSSALHEGQHAIQQIEDFAAGGNLLTGASPGNDHIRRGSTMMLEAITEGAFGARPQRPLLPWQRDEWSKGVARIEAADLKYSEGKRIAEEGRRLNQAPLPTLDQMLRNYRNLAGETEARAVEKRLEYSPDERTARPPWLDYDVPEGDQVVRFNANDSNAAAPSLALNAMDPQSSWVSRSATAASSETPYPIGQLESSAPSYVSTSIADQSNLLSGMGGNTNFVTNFIDQGLPMDQVSRLERARSMGFDTENVYYRGTNVDETHARPNTWIASDPVYSNSFAGVDDGANVMPMFARGKYSPAEWMLSPEEAKRAGFTGREFGDGTRQVFDPANLRSVNAAFDPSKSDSSFLLAANDTTSAAPSLALNAMEKPQGIRAYHGSPHDFDKFSMEHIGKGEGNQSYGRGLYFADSEDVAKGYRDGLSNGSPGHMYEVNINAQPEQFLDWDAPLSQQSEFVRNALLPLAKDQAELELARRSRNHARNDAQIRQLFGKEPPPREPLPSADELALRLWGNEIGPGNEGIIREAGVPGIRYLDGASRSNGDGMRNYTVFDDSLIDIMRKYANPETAAAPSLLLNSEDVQQNPLLANEEVSTSDILRRYGLLTPDRPEDPPVNTIPRGAPDPFDRYNDPWGEVPMIINNPFADPPPPEPKRLPRPLPFQLGPPSG